MATPNPTPLATTNRYIGAGKRRVVYVPTVAVLGAPTLAEMNAGTDLTGQIKQDGLQGFSTTSNTVDAGDYGSRKAKKAAGLIDFVDSSIDFHADSSGTNPVATLLARDVTGFICDCFAGLTGTKMNIFAIIVTVSSAMVGSAGETVAWHTGYALTDSAENVAVPTA